MTHMATNSSRPLRVMPSVRPWEEGYWGRRKGPGRKCAFWGGFREGWGAGPNGGSPRQPLQVCPRVGPGLGVAPGPLDPVTRPAQRGRVVAAGVPGGVAPRSVLQLGPPQDVEV